MFTLIKKRRFGDMLALWYEETGAVAQPTLGEGKRIEFQLIPAEMEERIISHRRDNNDTVACRVLHKIWDLEFFAARPENAIQFKISGDPNAWLYSAGSSMRNSGSTERLKTYELADLPDGVLLTMRDDRGLVARQRVCEGKNARFVTVSTSLENTGDETLALEYLAAFSLGGLSPFQPDDGPGCYRIARWLSGWSAEGRPEIRRIEDCGLERSWAGFVQRTLRFGELGMTPVRDYFPQAAFLDERAGVAWGASLDAFASWQLEFSRSLDSINLSGGIPDREFGHWKKFLAPGEIFDSGEAALTVCRGDEQDVQNRLVGYGQGEVKESEKDLPILFNDWCTTWGKPYPENLLPIADMLRRYPIRYFVMDDGWFRKDGYGIGDWVVVPDKYPAGLKAFSAELRGKGYIPGIWFEFENAVVDSRLYREKPEWFLHFDGARLRTGIRGFLDFRKEEVIRYLAEKVIAFLRDNDIGYMKVDYNSPTGYGCDGAESKGEGLRQHALGVKKFFGMIAEALPDLVLEICASGGHRLSSAWMRLSSMASFSDAHEGVEIPIIAANTAGLIPVRKNQIWAVLHPEDDDDRLCYSLAAGFLGRLCLSGELAKLDEHQRLLVEKACGFYREAVPVLREGNNRVTRAISPAWLAPQGVQIFLRCNDALALVVLHAFGDAPGDFSADLPGKWKLLRAFGAESIDARTDGQKIVFSGIGDFRTKAVLLQKED
ncbi:MAG: alpha-galactosidase [Victivallaceae bacterium]|nr:alpha-galactosidase [Victivallaceae bacterium]